MTASRPDPHHRLEGTVVLLSALTEKDLASLFTGLGTRPTTPDGIWRDTAVYSVLREEWPRVRSILDELQRHRETGMFQARLVRDDGAGVLAH